MKSSTKGKKNLEIKKEGKFTVTCFLKIPFCQCFAVWNKNALKKQKKYKLFQNAKSSLCL